MIDKYVWVYVHIVWGLGFRVWGVGRVGVRGQGLGLRVRTCSGRGMGSEFGLRLKLWRRYHILLVKYHAQWDSMRGYKPPNPPHVMLHSILHHSDHCGL